MLNDLTRQSKDSSAAKIALIYAGLGANDQAMALLPKTPYSERSNPLILLRPGFDPLRSDPISKTIAPYWPSAVNLGAKSFHVRQTACKPTSTTCQTCCRVDQAVNWPSVAHQGIQGSNPVSPPQVGNRISNCRDFVNDMSKK